MANGLLSAETPPGPALQNNIDSGHRFCECFETYRLLIPRPALSFEWGWNLLLSIRRGDELGLKQCDACSVCYIVDLLALPETPCPGCLLLKRHDTPPLN